MRPRARHVEPHQAQTLRRDFPVASFYVPAMKLDIVPSEWQVSSTYLASDRGV